jgi:hypothetical protein
MTLAAVWRTPPHSHRPRTSFKWRFARPLTSFKWRFARPLTLPSPPMGARVLGRWEGNLGASRARDVSLSLIEGEGRGEGDK